MYQSTKMNLPERFYLTQKIDSVAVTPWLILLFSDVYFFKSTGMIAGILFHGLIKVTLLTIALL